MTINIRDLEGYEAFRNECTYFDCREEYPGWTGTERYAVISSLDPDELTRRFPEIIKYLSPVLFLDSRFGEVRRTCRNEKRRNEENVRRYESIYCLEDIDEGDYLDMNTWSMEEVVTFRLALEAALKILTDIQRRRLKKYYFENMSMQEIADEEEISYRAVHNSINQALVRLRLFFQQA